MLFRVSLFLSALLAGAAASNVIELTPDNFDQIIGKGKPALIEFFAPWCGHCKSLAPIYEQLADSYAHAKDKVIIAKVDADGAGKPLGKKFGVTGYPTLKWFDAEGNTQTEDKYSGGRDLDSLAAFILQKTGVKSNVPVPPPTDVNILDYHTFDDVVMDKTKNVIVTFTAPWCGHCKTLKPIYEKVAATFKPESNCVVANFDGDDAKNRDIANRYNIAGFPTIKFFSTDNKESPVDYEGGRDEASITKFLNEKCGTQRAVGGGLNDDAGRVASLDSVAYKFFTADASARDSLYSEASKLAADVATAGAKYYIRVMDKLKSGAQGFVEKESKRLGGIISKRSLGQVKLDELKIKLNILNSFQTERAEEKADNETIQRAEAEL